MMLVDDRTRGTCHRANQLSIANFDAADVFFDLHKFTFISALL